MLSDLTRAAWPLKEGRHFWVVAATLFLTSRFITRDLQAGSAIRVTHGAFTANLPPQIEEAIEEHEGEGEHEEDDLSSAEREMLRNILHFGERTVGDIGVPRGDIIAVPETICFADLVARFARGTKALEETAVAPA